MTNKFAKIYEPNFITICNIRIILYNLEYCLFFSYYLITCLKIIIFFGQLSIQVEQVTEVIDFLPREK